MYPLSVFIAWLLDKLFGDPVWLPHPVVLFGKTIALGEKHLNRGTHRRLKGGILAVVLILLTFLLTHWLMRFLFSLHPLALSESYIYCLGPFSCGRTPTSSTYRGTRHLPAFSTGDTEGSTRNACREFERWGSGTAFLVHPFGSSGYDDLQND